MYARSANSHTNNSAAFVMFERLKQDMAAILRFVGSRVFLLNMGLLLSLGYIFLSLLFAWLMSYTNHGESISVPEIKGMKLEMAQDLIEDKGLEIMILDSMYTDSIEPNVILSQEPQPDEKVKENRRIYVTISSTNVPMKDVSSKWVGKGVKEVRLLMRQRGFVIEKELTIDGEFPGEVRKIVHEHKTIFEYVSGKGGGKEILKSFPIGTKFTIFVTTGPGGEVPIPNLVCRSLQEAISILQMSSINVGAIIGSAPDSLNAFVWQQEPPFFEGERMRKGEAIDLHIQAERPTECGEDVGDAPVDGN